LPRTALLEENAGGKKERGVHPAIVFARVRNALKRRGVTAFLKELVCLKSSEVIEKKPVVGSCVCAPSRKPFRTRKGAQAEENTGLVFCWGKPGIVTGGEEGSSDPSQISLPAPTLGARKSGVEQFEWNLITPASITSTVLICKELFS